MKINSNKLRKVQIIMDCVIIAIFGEGIIISLSQDQYRETSLFLLLVLAWLLMLLKDLDIMHYAELVDLYKEVTKENDEFLAKLINFINEKQTDNDTDNQR